MFTWIENEIITINPGKESKKVREGKFSKKTGVTLFKKKMVDRRRTLARAKIRMLTRKISLASNQTKQPSTRNACHQSVKIKSVSTSVETTTTFPDNPDQITGPVLIEGSTP